MPMPSIDDTSTAICVCCERVIAIVFAILNNDVLYDPRCLKALILKSQEAL